MYNIYSWCVESLTMNEVDSPFTEDLLEISFYFSFICQRLLFYTLAVHWKNTFSKKLNRGHSFSSRGLISLSILMYKLKEELLSLVHIVRDFYFSK